MGDGSTTKMFEAQTIAADHKDLIHDVAYDFYGERMATCSSDQYVKIWDTDGHNGWRLSSSWKAHHGSVWKVTWAHPEFGQVIATCSFDRTAAIWEEVGDTTVPGTERGLRQWVKRSNLVDSRTSVTDVKFGPKHLGLLLVTCSADGIIRIYEAPDVMNLAQWTLQHEIPMKVSISCLSWNPSLSRVNPPMLAVGSDEPSTAADKAGAGGAGRVFLFEYGEHARRWTRSEPAGGGGGGGGGNVPEPVNDLAFAPSLGRAFHLLAVATKDVRIIKIEPISEATPSPSANGASAPRFKTELLAAFEEHHACVWRVSWNVTGTLLASSGDDCCVRLWKMQYLNQWKCVAVLKNERSGAGAGAGAGGAGAGAVAVAGVAADGPPPPRPHTAYIKMAAIANPSHMPWH